MHTHNYLRIVWITGFCFLLLMIAFLLAGDDDKGIPQEPGKLEESLDPLMPTVATENPPIERTEIGSLATKPSTQLKKVNVLTINRDGQPLAWVEVKVFGLDLPEKEPVFFGMAISDGNGLVEVSIPASGPFSITGEFLEDRALGDLVGTREISTELAENLEGLFPNGIPLYLWAKQALVEVHLNCTALTKSEGAWVMVGPEAVPGSIVTRKSGSTSYSRLVPGEDILSSFKVEPGTRVFCGLYSVGGNLVKELSSAVALKPGEIWSVELVIVDQLLWSEYFFELHSDADPEGIDRRFYIGFVNRKSGSVAKTSDFSFSPGKVYLADMPIGGPFNVEITHPVLGYLVKEVLPGQGVQEGSPDQLYPTPPVRVFLNPAEFPGLGNQRKTVELTLLGGVNKTVRLKSSGNEERMEISFPFGPNVVGLKVGNRLFSCNFEGVKGRCVVPGSPFSEVAIPGIVRVQLDSEERQKPGQLNTLKFYRNGIAWATRTVRAENGFGFQLEMELPVGVVDLVWSDGLGGESVRGLLHVSSDGMRISLDSFK
jgi:hypothetical protein